MDAEHPRLGARYRVDEMDKELFLFAYLPDEYAVDDVELGLDQLDRTANAAAIIAIQAVAAERERCCRDVCPQCKHGLPLEFRKRPDGGIRGLPPTWLHFWAGGIWTVCHAADIHERTRAGGKGNGA